MKRKIDQTLDEWAKNESRIPLIIRGARQVGKSYSIETFGQRTFESTVTINFEKKMEYTNWTLQNFSNFEGIKVG